MSVDPENLHDSCPFDRRTSKLKVIGWPVFFVLTPITLLVGTLSGLILQHQIIARSSRLTQQLLFQNACAHILVDYPATRLTFLASWLSTLAPLLSASIMGIWCCYAARALQQASNSGSPNQLPTTSGIDYEIAILQASFTNLGRYYIDLVRITWGQVSRRTTSFESLKTLHPSAAVLSLCGLIVVTIFASEAYLDAFTETIAIDLPTMSEVTSWAFGRGMSSFCLDFNRMQNFGFPCSYAMDQYVSQSQLTEEYVDANELFSLQHNISQKSSIQIIGDLAVLLPQTLTLPRNLDFEATTIGVSTMCKPITSTCDLQVADDDMYNTYFNCSKNFWGVLGKSPNTTDMSWTYQKAIDHSLPGMNFKLSANLQYGFYPNESLFGPYVTAPYNPQTGDLLGNASILPDSKLINPTFMGVAARIPVSGQSEASTLNSDGEFFQKTGQYLDFILGCSYTTYNVTYTWFNGSVAHLSSSIILNGSVSEIYHGAQIFWEAPSDTSFLLEDDMLVAGHESTSVDLARVWANLYSVRVLSTIGAYTTPRSNLREQIRTPMLVAKIPMAALATLVAGTLSYAVLAIVLGIVVTRIVHNDPGVLGGASFLSQSGLAAHAFRNDNGAVGRGDLYSQPRSAAANSLETETRVGLSPKGLSVIQVPPQSHTNPRTRGRSN